MKTKIACSLFVFALTAAFALDPGQPVRSARDFESLRKDGVYPINLLSDTTFNSLKKHIVFDEEHRFRGFNYNSGLREELSPKEQEAFLNLLIHGKRVPGKN